MTAESQLEESESATDSKLTVSVGALKREAVFGPFVFEELPGPMSAESELEESESAKDSKTSSSSEEPDALWSLV